MRVLMHENQLCERGTTQALVDYARGLAARGHEIVITYPRDAPANNQMQIEAISREFSVIAYDDPDQLSDLGNDFDSAYFIKSGFDDGRRAGSARTVVHCVFQDYEPHGNYYGYVSQWLADHMRHTVTGWRGRRGGLYARGQLARAAGCSNSLNFDSIPHACDMPQPQQGQRDRLGVPESAFMILRYGGVDTFDIDWAKSSLVDLLDANPDWYFVGVNTEPFTTHERARFAPAVYDKQEKADLLGSADVFLTARARGESFGLANVEALQMGLPVLAWSGGFDRNHVSMLRDLDGLYKNPRQLRRKLLAIRSGEYAATRSRRIARGNEFRSDIVIPILEAALMGPGAS